MEHARSRSSFASIQRRSSVIGHHSSRVGSARDDAHRRTMELKEDLETAIHVLDNGVNRTPLPLQQHRNVSGMRQRGRGGAETTELGSSIFQSSLMSSDGHSVSKYRNSLSTSLHKTESNSVENSQSLFGLDGTRADEASTSASGVHAGVELSQMRAERCSVFGRDSYEKHKPLTDQESRAWLRSNTTVALTETPTILLYNHQDEIVSNENMEEVAAVVARIATLEALEEAHRLDEGVRFQGKSAMTLIAPKKSIHSEVHPPRSVDSGALQVTSWMLRDEFAPLLDEGDDDMDPDKLKDEEDLDLEEDLQEEDMAGDSSEGQSTQLTNNGPTNRSSSNAWMLADSLMSNLRIMERAVVQNVMEKTQLAYRGIEMKEDCARVPKPVALELSPSPNKAKAGEGHIPQWLNGGGANDSAADSESGDHHNQSSQDAPENATENTSITREKADLPAMRMSPDFRALWRYHCPETAGRSVTAMAWNRKESDVLAVGYSVRRPGVEDGTTTEAVNGVKNGHAATKDLFTQRGMICCWSLKNPLAPELVLHLTADAGVSSLAFSYEHPSLLAVGNTAGGIVVYDIQKDLAAPSIVPAFAAGLHTGAVWDLKWVASGKDRSKFLMSISADGRVVQWAVGKTVEKVAPDLMHLKRQPGAQIESAFVEGVAAADEAAGRRRRCGAKEEAVLSRQAGGMCFDVCPSDHAIYVVGTEDGSIYQCNKSQTESYDLDYAPHAELVYRVRWSPYSSKYFLTCSADWTTRLYALSNSTAMVKYDSPNQDAVQDVAWSYTNSLFFVTATAQGNVELWSVVDYIYPRASIQYEDHRRLTAVMFAEQETPVVIVGDDEGDVTVFLLTNDVYRRHNMTDEEQEMWLEEAIRKQAA